MKPQGLSHSEPSRKLAYNLFRRRAINALDNSEQRAVESKEFQEKVEVYNKALSVTSVPFGTKGCTEGWTPNQGVLRGLHQKNRHSVYSRMVKIERGGGV